MRTRLRWLILVWVGALLPGVAGAAGGEGGGAIGPLSGTIQLAWKADGTNIGPITTSGPNGDEVIGSFTETFHADWDLTITLDGTLAGEKRAKTRDHVEEIYSGGRVTIGKIEVTYTRTDTVRGESGTITDTEKTTGGSPSAAKGPGDSQPGLRADQGRRQSRLCALGRRPRARP